MIDAIIRLLAPVRRQVANMVARGVVNLVNDSKKFQLLQVELLNGETKGEIERAQNYGFSSVPKSGSEVVALFVGGQRGHGLVISVDDRRTRPTGLNEGEAVVYDSTGTRILLKDNGDIELTPSSGNVKVTGTLTATVDVVGGGKSLKNHTHSAGAMTAGGDSVVGSTGGPT